MHPSTFVVVLRFLQPGLVLCWLMEQDSRYIHSSHHWYLPCCMQKKEFQSSLFRCCQNTGLNFKRLLKIGLFWKNMWTFSFKNCEITKLILVEVAGTWHWCSRLSFSISVIGLTKVLGKNQIFLFISTFHQSWKKYLLNNLFFFKVDLL